MRGAHPPLAIGIVIIFMGLLSICARGGRSRSITLWVIPPGDAIEVVVFIHGGEGWSVSTVVSRRNRSSLLTQSWGPERYSNTKDSCATNMEDEKW
jgi:hypothetical protein